MSSGKQLHHNAAIYRAEDALENIVKEINEQKLLKNDPLTFFKALADLFDANFTIQQNSSRSRSKAKATAVNIMPADGEGCQHKYKSGGVEIKGKFCGGLVVDAQNFCSKHIKSHVGDQQIDGIEYKKEDQVVKVDGKKTVMTFLISVGKKAMPKMLNDKEDVIDIPEDILALRDDPASGIALSIPCAASTASKEPCKGTAKTGHLCPTHARVIKNAQKSK